MGKSRLSKLSVVVLAAIAGCLVGVAPRAQAQKARDVRVIHEAKHDVSLTLREMAKMVGVQNMPTGKSNCALTP